MYSAPTTPTGHLRRCAVARTKALLADGAVSRSDPILEDRVETEKSATGGSSCSLRSLALRSVTVDAVRTKLLRAKAADLQRAIDGLGPDTDEAALMAATEVALDALDAIQQLVDVLCKDRLLVRAGSLGGLGGLGLATRIEDWFQLRQVASDVAHRVEEISWAVASTDLFHAKAQALIYQLTEDITRLKTHITQNKKNMETPARAIIAFDEEPRQMRELPLEERKNILAASRASDKLAHFKLSKMWKLAKNHGRT